jgi:hypothetical protein
MVFRVKGLLGQGLVLSLSHWRRRCSLDDGIKDADDAVRRDSGRLDQSCRFRGSHGRWSCRCYRSLSRRGDEGAGRSCGLVALSQPHLLKSSTSWLLTTGSKIDVVVTVVVTDCVTLCVEMTGAGVT